MFPRNTSMKCTSERTACLINYVASSKAKRFPLKKVMYLIKKLIVVV
jgi:hypothetical protein